MALTNYAPSLQYAKEHHITIGALNCFNMESVQACAWAAETLEVPVILQCYHEHLGYCGAEAIAAAVRAEAWRVKQGVSIGLDHGRSFDQARQCIEAGFTGVMIDLSSDDLDRNIHETKRVVKMAHAKGVSVEAELGLIMSAKAAPEEIAKGFTDPAMARKFAEATGVDCLAVAIGTAHGAYAYKPQIDFDRLEQLIAEVPCPIVVHGGSGTPDEDVARMARMGVGKLNIGTDLFNAFDRGVRKYYAEKENGSIFGALTSGRNAVYETACHKLSILSQYRI